MLWQRLEQAFVLVGFHVLHEVFGMRQGAAGALDERAIGALSSGLGISMAVTHWNLAIEKRVKDRNANAIRFYQA